MKILRPLQNRVAPDGELVATPARGTLYGNRGGRFHDPVTRTLPGRRRSASRAWIACELEFKGWWMEVWGSRFTGLFFLDEVTALAAGHRPCYLCRRGDALRFAAAVAAHESSGMVCRAPELDRRLHGERGRCTSRPWGSLPDGAVVARDGGFAAVRGDTLLPWSFEGYGASEARPWGGEVAVVTPPTVLSALAGGFLPRWHPSA